MRKKIVNIKKRTEDLRVSCESKIVELNHKIDELKKKESDLNDICDSLYKLIKQKKLVGVTVGRIEIFENLRKIAVIQHNITCLAVEIKTIKEEKVLAEQNRDQELLKRNDYYRKGKKYDFMLNIIRENIVKKIDYEEESEQEEVIYANTDRFKSNG